MALRQLRELHKYSQQYVADSVGVTLERYQMYETGEVKPVGSTYHVLGKVFGLDVFQMMNIIENTPQSESKTDNPSV